MQNEKSSEVINFVFSENMFVDLNMCAWKKCLVIKMSAICIHSNRKLQLDTTYYLFGEPKKDI